MVGIDHVLGSTPATPIFQIDFTLLAAFMPDPDPASAFAKVLICQPQPSDIADLATSEISQSEQRRLARIVDAPDHRLEHNTLLIVQNPWGKQGLSFNCKRASDYDAANPAQEMVSAEFPWGEESLESVLTIPSRIAA